MLLIVDNQYLPVAKSLIEQAKNSICVSSFKAEVRSPPKGKEIQKLWDLLKERAKAGVKIRLLLNWNAERKSVAKTNLPLARELKQYNIKVRHLRNNRCCHAKMILIDKDKAILGSHNLSVKSCNGNFELSYLISDPVSVMNISSVFDNSWNDAQDF